MQQIERYGVMVLLFMLVTILVVSLWDGEGEPEQPPRTPSVAAATSSISAPASTRDLPTRPVAVPARERETRRVPLAATSSRTNPQRRRGARREPEHVLPTPQVRTVGPPLPAATPDAGPAPQAHEVARAPRPETPRMAGPTGVASTGQGAGEGPVRRPRTDPPRSAGREAPRAWTYEIKSGDTLQGIASRVLGDGNRWREIQEANPGLDPRRLFVGERINLPGGSTPAVSSSVTPASAPTTAAAPRPAASGGYVIQKGDVLSRIAQTRLGSARRWREIVDLNPGLDPNRLMVGQTLRLPGDAAVPARAVAPARSREAVAQASSSDSARYRVR